MSILNNARHECFAQGIFTGMSATDSAIYAGYKPEWAGTNTTKLLTNTNIRDRIAELFTVSATSAVMSIKERMERLTEIARGRLSDFIKMNEDGTVASIDIKAGNNGALEDVVVTEFKGGPDHRAEEKRTKIKLHDPVRCIAELNRMTPGAYAPSKLELEPGETLTPILEKLLGDIIDIEREEAKGK